MAGNYNTIFKPYPQVKWPNGLTVDTVAERLYWVDAQQDYIASTDLDGANMKKILSSRLEVSHPFAVAVLKETVYWDDWTRKAVFQADKNTGNSISVLKNNMAGIVTNLSHITCLAGSGAPSKCKLPIFSNSKRFGKGARAGDTYT
jgi:sugar lactone lactonase YvrE